MTCRKTVLAIALLTLVGLVPHSVQAAPLRIPATLYPTGAHIGYRPVLTNAEVDCMWGFTCEGGYIPNFHFRTQDLLHRLSGWGQFAGVQQHGRTTMAFELFAGRYDPASDETGTSWSERAVIDLQAALHVQGYRQVRRNADAILGGHVSSPLLAVQHLGKQDLVVMACRSGSLELEGIALYDHRLPAAKRIAWNSLALQIHRAVKLGQ
jgi:hypothetical protein